MNLVTLDSGGSRPSRNGKTQMFSTLQIMAALAALTGPGQIPAAHANAEIRQPAPTSLDGEHRLAQAPRRVGTFKTSQPPALFGAPRLPVQSASGDNSNRSGASRTPRRNIVMLERCLVSLMDDLELTAQEDGILTSVEVREGMPVKKKRQLAQIDDRESEARRVAASAAHLRAKEEAENNVDQRFAEASEKVAKADYDQGLAANRRHAGAVAPAEIRRRKLAWDKTVLSIEQAKVDRALAGRDMEIRAAELEQASYAVKRRKIVSPMDGLIVEVKKRAGAWVTRGEPLMRIVRMDRLRIAGHVNAAKFGPHEINGRSVSIRVRLERGRIEHFKGKVVFVHPEQHGGDYLVWAEVKNSRQNKQWVLRPGLHVDMAIHLAPGQAPSAPSR